MTEALVWLLQIAGIFMAFSIQGAMWMGAQQERQRGWLIALIWAVGTVLLFNTVHDYHDSQPLSHT